MKKVLSPAIAACMAMLLAGCNFGNEFSVSTDGGDDGRGTTTMEIRNGDYHIKVKYSGDIAFTDSETAIKSISPGGCLKYWKNGKKVIALSNKDGVITYQMYNGGETVYPGEEKGRRLMALVVKDLINLGFDAKGRVDRIYKKGGTAAVLDEIDYLKSNYVRQLYFEQLLNTKYLTAAEMNQVAKSITITIDGGYEKSQLLTKFAGAFVADGQTCKAYFDAVKSIGGDYEKSTTLQKVAEQPLTKTGRGQLLDVANTIGSDYEKANVLKKVIEKRGLGQENCDKLLEVAGGIGGEYEKSGVLAELAENDSLSAESFNRALFVTIHIGGDYEKSEVLKKFAAQYITTDDEWISLINATAQLNAAYEKCSVMVDIAKKMPKDDKVKAAYMEAAKTITSDYEYAQAVKATQQ